MDKRSHGFTIVELLIVIVVIAILAAISITAYNGIQQRASNVSARAANVQASKTVQLHEAQYGTLPTSITDCPSPSAGNICTPTKAGQTVSYFVFGAGIPNRYSAAVHSAEPAYELQVLDEKSFSYYSTAEITHTNEFVQYMDMAPIINKYGLRPYTISFDIKSENTATQSTVNVYMQNGSTARYTFSQSVPVTTSYQRRSITVTPAGPNTSVTASILAFYGNYGTGNRPTIKNLEITAG